MQAPLTLKTRLLCVVIGLSVLLQHSAVVHHQTRLLSTALQRWRDRRQSQVVASQHMMLALQHYLYKFERKVWAAWTKVECHMILDRFASPCVSHSMCSPRGRIVPDVNMVLVTITLYCSIGLGRAGRYSMWFIQHTGPVCTVYINRPTTTLLQERMRRELGLIGSTL